MIHGISLTVVPARDLARAKGMYAAVLGVEPYADAPYYVGFRVGDLEIGLDPHGHDQGMTGPIDYWQVDDIEKSVESFRAAGAAVQQDIKDVGGGKRTAWVKDTDDNVIGLIQQP